MRLITRLFAGASLSLLIVSPAAAQFAVIDAANLAQNVMTAARMLEEVNDQIVSLQHEVQMLENEARNLTSLDYSSLVQLNDALDRINQLMGQAQGIQYTVQSVDQQFQRYYPQTYGAGTTDDQLIEDARTRWEYSVESFQHTMGVQSQIVSGIPADQQQMSALVDQSQAAVGILQAAQAGNQLLALQSQQLSSVQALLAAQGRTVAVEAARRAEAQEQAHEQFQRFLGTGDNYVPVPVQAFH
jgi:P-type conjugative transfer protein TrbJ